MTYCGNGANAKAVRNRAGTNLEITYDVASSTPFAWVVGQRRFVMTRRFVNRVIDPNAMIHAVQPKLGKIGGKSRRPVP